MAVDKLQLTEVARHFMTETDKGATQAKDAMANDLSTKVDPDRLNKALRAAASTASEVYAPVSQHIASENKEVRAADLIQQLFQKGEAEGKPLEQIVRDVLREAQERKIQQHPEAVSKLMVNSGSNQADQKLNSEDSASTSKMRPK